jgi:hypothetical protein
MYHVGQILPDICNWTYFERHVLSNVHLGTYNVGQNYSSFIVKHALLDIYSLAYHVRHIIGHTLNNVFFQTYTFGQIFSDMVDLYCYTDYAQQHMSNKAHLLVIV